MGLECSKKCDTLFPYIEVLFEVKSRQKCTGQQTENYEQSNRPGLVKSQSQFLQDKNEKYVFEITLHNHIA